MFIDPIEKAAIPSGMILIALTISLK